MMMMQNTISFVVFPIFGAAAMGMLMGQELVRDALGGVGESSLSIFTGFLNVFEKSNIRKSKIGQNPFNIRSKYV